MVRVYTLFLILFMLASCAGKSTPVDDRSSAGEASSIDYHGYGHNTPEGRYYELMSFKDSPDFHAKGFAKDTEYLAWQDYCRRRTKDQSLGTEERDKYRALGMIGLLYYQNKGKDNQMTRMLTGMVFQDKTRLDVPAPPIVK